MNEMAYPAEWDEISEFDPLPEDSNPDHFGPGFTEENLTKIKIAQLMDQPLAVVGFLTKPNDFKKLDTDPDLTTGYEVMDPEGNHYLFWHTSGRLKTVVHARFKKGEFPFKTTIFMAQPKKDGGNPYYNMK